LPELSTSLEQLLLTLNHTGEVALRRGCCQVDGCYADPKQYAELYPLLGKYLNETGRAITYSCSWPAYLPDPTKTAFQVTAYRVLN
jgi:hypothetical protein